MTTQSGSKRQRRHQAILEIIRSQGVRTQQELTQLLVERGFHCTQATVSRDISELKLVKDRNKCYTQHEDLRLRRQITDTVHAVDAAGNMVVVKTVVGGANALCAVLDASSLPGILGTVAGDDTIFMVARSPEDAEAVVGYIAAMNRR